MNPSDIVLEDDEDPEMVLQRADRVQGVGFDKQHILSMSSKAIMNQQACEVGEGEGDEGGKVTMNKLSAVNVEDLKYLD